MLLVPVIIQPSEIHGLGVFCARPLHKGMCVWMYREPYDMRILLAKLGTYSKALQEHARYVGYRPRGKDYLEIPYDAAQFINHSKDPNLRVDPENMDMYTVCDMPAFTELTCDYYDLDENPEVAGALKD